MIELTVKTITPEVVESIRRTAMMAEDLKIKSGLVPSRWKRGCDDARGYEFNR